MANKGIRVGLYLRISFDRDGRAIGIGRQEEDCRALANALGWTVVDVYPENDTSAFKRRAVTLPGGGKAFRVVRPEFRRLLDDLEGGALDSLIVYDLDRLARDPRDLEDLIDVKESKHVDVRSVTGSVRLDSDADITMARVMVAMNNKSSRDTARRVSRAAKQRAQEGGFHGGPVAFGYEQQKDAAGKVVAWVPHAEHAAWLSEAADRLLAGETLYGICSDWHRQGRRTNAGIVWRSRTLRRNLTTPTIIGVREYQGQHFKAQWEPIMSRETWDQLQTLFESQSTKHGPHPGHTTIRKYPLLGILFCGHVDETGKTCDHRLASMTGSKSGPAAYFCSTQATGGCGKLRIAMDRIEPWLLAQVVSIVDDLKIERGSGHEAEIRDARNAVGQDETALNQMDDDHYAGLLPRPDWLRQRSRVSDRLETNRRLFTDLVAQSTRTSIPSGPELERQWPDRDASWKHTMMSSVIEKVVVYPHPTGLPYTLTRRRAESDDDLKNRREALLTKIMDLRVDVTWRA